MSDGQAVTDEAAWLLAILRLRDAFEGSADEPPDEAFERLTKEAMARGLVEHPVSDPEVGMMVTPLGLDLIGFLMGATPPSLRRTVLEGLKGANFEERVRDLFHDFINDARAEIEADG